MKRKEMPAPVNPQRKEYMILSPTQTLVKGEEVTVTGKGRFTFHYGWNEDEGTFWGPINSKAPMWRTFKRHQIKTVHRKRQAHGTTND